MDQDPVFYHTNREVRNTDPRRTRIGKKILVITLNTKTFSILPCYTVPDKNHHRSLLCAVRLANIKIYGTGTVPVHRRYRHRSLFCAARLVNINLRYRYGTGFTVGTDIREKYNTSIPYHK
jgi:hypothetical protein